MKKIISLLLGSIVAFALSASVAYSAANQVRVAFFLESGHFQTKKIKLNRLLTML